jgi:hypothetical protein
MGEVPQLLDQYRGREKLLFEMLRQKYVTKFGENP